MKVASIVLIGLAFLPCVAHARQGPSIKIVDGKVSMSAKAVPLGRLLVLLDRATGMTSKVIKPELENRNITVEFTDLEFNDAVRKIFQGLPLNYIVIPGKGIRVTELADATASPASSPAATSFPGSQPINSNPAQSLVPLGQTNPLAPAANAPQPPVINTLFGPVPNPNATAAPPSSSAPMTMPGQLPPPAGAGNPLIGPTNTGGGPAGPTPAAPAAPGTLGGATPGTIGR